jgi:hypothetical protein
MTHKEPLNNLEALIAYFEKIAISFNRTEKDETAISLSTRLGDRNGILHIRWESSEGYIRFIHVLPLQVPGKLREKMIILLNRINLVLPILGFVLNEEDGIITYCSQAFLDQNGSIPSYMIDAVIFQSIRTVNEILPQLQQSVTRASGEDLSSLFKDHP